MELNLHVWVAWSEWYFVRYSSTLVTLYKHMIECLAIGAVDGWCPLQRYYRWLLSWRVPLPSVCQGCCFYHSSFVRKMDIRYAIFQIYQSSQIIYIACYYVIKPRVRSPFHYSRNNNNILGVIFWGYSLKSRTNRTTFNPSACILYCRRD